MKKRYTVAKFNNAYVMDSRKKEGWFVFASSETAARLIARALNEQEARKRMDSICSRCLIKLACGKCETKRRVK